MVVFPPTVFANTSALPPFVTARGVAYHPLWRAIPLLEPFYTKYEKGKTSDSWATPGTFSLLIASPGMFL